jgi:flagellar FliJ protein
MDRAFRLAGLLRLRELQEDQAAARLAASHAVLRDAERRRRDTLDTLVRHAMPEHADAGVWRLSVTGRASLSHLLADAGVAVADAGVRVGQDTADWSGARSRSVGLEKLRDKHREAVALEDGRAEQHALDEVASRTARTGVAGIGSPRPGSAR